MKNTGTTDLKGYLQAELANSVNASVYEIVSDARLATTADQVNTKVEATAAALKALGMLEELRLLVWFLISTLGRKGLRLSEAITNFLVPDAPAPALTEKVVAISPAQPKPALKTRPVRPKPMIPGVLQEQLGAWVEKNGSQPPTAPARQLEPEPVDNRFDNWKRGLKRVVEGKIEGGLSGFFKDLQAATQSVFQAGFELANGDWELLFSAMKRARETGNFIVGNLCKPGLIFKEAPTNLLQEHLFGIDGAVVAVTAEVADCGELLSLWLGPKAGIVFDMAFALNGRVAVDEIDRRKLRLLKKAIGEKGNVPDWLEAKFKSLTIGEEPAPASVPPAVPEVKAEKPKLVAADPKDGEWPPKGTKPLSKGDRKRVAKEEAVRRANAKMALSLEVPVNETLASEVEVTLQAAEGSAEPLPGRSPIPPVVEVVH